MITEHKIRGGESTLKQFCVICIFLKNYMLNCHHAYLNFHLMSVTKTKLPTLIMPWVTSHLLRIEKRKLLDT